MKSPDLPSEAGVRRRVWLLGGLRVEDGGRPVSIPSGQAESLFAFLVLHAETTHTREQLADLIWPDEPPERTQHNFSNLLYRLRKSLGPGWLSVDGHRIAMEVGPDLWTDVWAFEELTEADDPAALERAAALYAGDLLPEIYDDWVLLPRLALQEKHFACLLRLGRIAEQQDQYETASEHYRRLAEVDPLREAAHLGIMRSLAGTGRTAEALAAYTKLERLLDEELGVQPGEEARALAERLRSELETREPERNVFVRPPFVGRVAERRRLLTRLDQAQAGQGGIVAVLGEAGSGKTRLLEETAQAATWRGWQVMWGQAEQRIMPSLYSPLRDALARALPTPRWRQLSALVSRTWLMIVAKLVLHRPEDVDERALAQLTTDAQQLARAIGRVLGGLQQIVPHLLILDDVQWADPAIWPLLEELREPLAESGVLLVLSARTDELREQEAWSTLRDWDRAGVPVISLDGLAAEELADLIAVCGVDDDPTERAARLKSASGGNPLLALALIQAGDLDQVPVHPSVTDLTLRRLTHLSDGARRALEAAAVVGFEFSYALWETLLEQGGLAPGRLPALAGELERAGLVYLGADAYRFAHETLRAAVYGQMPDADRRRLHAHALNGLRQHGPDDPTLFLHHAEQAGNPAAVARYALQAGAQALERFAFQAADRYFALALKALPSDDWSSRYRAVRGRAQALAVLGDAEAQRRQLDLLQRLADQLGDVQRQAEAFQHRAQFAWLSGEQDDAKSLAERGLSLAKRAQDAVLEAGFLETLGRIARNQGDYHQAEQWVRQAYELYRQAEDRFGEASTLDKLANLAYETGDPTTAAQRHTEAAGMFRELGAIVYEARALSGLALALRRAGDYERAQEIHRQALDITRELGDKHGEWVQIANLGGIAYELGDYAQAVERYTSALAVCRQLNDPRGTSMMLNNLGFSYHGLREPAQSLAYFDEGLQINQARGYRRGEGYTQKGRGLVLLDAEEYVQAREALEAARAIWVELDDRGNRIETVAALALAHLAGAELDQAVALFETALEDLSESDDHATLRQWVHYVGYRVCQVQGRLAEARRHLLQARAAMLEMAATLPAAANEDVWLESPLNRRTRAALDELSQRVQVSLVRADVPLGRKLTADDYIDVTWTVHAPEDDLIEKKTERRRHVLRRLLAEAEAQGAAPTDGDLADALDVSRRTILRDMQTLAEAGVPLSTRRRT